MFHMNVFRILADVSHTISKCILIWAIYSNKSAEGVSLITQALYALVFCTRYLDLFWRSPLDPSLWNFVLKIFYISTSFYIIFIMMRVYARTREREKAWLFGSYCLAGSVVLGPIVAAIALRKDTSLWMVVWTFSIVLESVCVVPQLLMLRQTTVPTVIDSGYILMLGAYRALYILNWILRFADKEEKEKPEIRAVIFGIIQTAFYADFAWVYWSRQRVKLRNGGVVDSEDLSRGFLVSRVLGKGDVGPDEEEVGDGSGTGKPNGGRWGKRGVSVSADDNVIMPGGKSKISHQDGGLADFMDDDEDEDARPLHQQQANGLVNGRQ